MSSWFAFWRTRNRFSLDELRYLTDQLQKIQFMSDFNTDPMIEMLRSIAELVTYGDQHDPSIFEFFMENEVLGEFVRILRMCRMSNVAIQLLQTISIMIQNLKNEASIYYIFSTEHINCLITYSFDFQNEELLSYYISFLRAISGKLNKNTISLLFKTKNDEVVSFPLYVEAIRFAFHEDNMIRIAVRAVTLNVYHVGDEYINKFVVCSPQSDYFSNIVNNFCKRCISLDDMIEQTSKKLDASDSSSSILDAVEEIEDNLFYFSDVISSGVPDLGKLLTDNILQLLVFPLLLPSLIKQNSGSQISIATSLYLLCSILHIFKTKDLASSISAALFCPLETFITGAEAKMNGCALRQSVSQDSQELASGLSALQVNKEGSEYPSPQPIHSSQSGSCRSHATLRELLLTYIVGGDELQILGSLSLLATFLQTKELDESVLDGLGILPQRKQHKKLLLEALVGEDTGEELLFSPTSMLKDNIITELDRYLQKLEDDYGFQTKYEINPKVRRYQVFDGLVSLFCRSNISADLQWHGGWLLRQLLPHGEEEFVTVHLQLLKDSYQLSTHNLWEEIKGIWCDVLVPLINDQWKACKRALEASSPPKDSKSVLLPLQRSSGGESSYAVAERVCETVKVFVLQRQLILFSLRGTLPDQPDVHDLYTPVDSSVITRAKSSGLNALIPKVGSEVSLVRAIPCRVSFERDRERHLFFLAISRGMSGWILLAQESPVKQQGGIVRITAPLAGSDPRIDDQHQKWLHLRIRPPTLPFLDTANSKLSNKGKAKHLIDGRWTLAFKDEESCKAAKSMLVQERDLQCSEVERRLKPFLEPPDHKTESAAPCATATAKD